MWSWFNKNMLRVTFLSTLFIVIAPFVSKAEESSEAKKATSFLHDPDRFAYADVRYGYTKLGHYFHTGMNYKHRFNIFKLSYSQVNNFHNNIDKNNKFHDISAMYGWSLRKKNFLFNVGVGIGGVWGNAVTNEKDLEELEIQVNPQIDIKTVGFPFEIGFSFTPPPKIKTFSSIGLVFFGNFNNQKSYVGAGINLSLGKVSPKLTEEQKKDPLRDYYVPKDQRRQKWYE